MTPLAKQLINQGQANHVLNDRQLARLLGGSDESRYGLVNRALKAGDLVRVKRGIYVLADELRDKPVHPFALAQHLEPGSYVSGESALSFHGWIPEAVHVVLSVVPKGKSVSYEHERLGKFEFRRMTTNTGYFLQSVARHELQQQVALIAEPLRALMDLVYLRKLAWQGLDFLTRGMRIDEQQLRTVTSLDITRLLDVYKGKREQAFLSELQRSLGL
ncbi:MAG: type IV toxin-antitoxin system AbiEi family antitoxin domain-containing protein [Gammaproteobacteria bacterium]|nr:type IV toxin-antitoxin system AbiEi family antitoxin domain-containing protein [Gammaproteobacteria bacterium]